MTPLFACSGPGAGKLIEDNIMHANQLAWTVGARAAASVVLYLFMHRYKVFPIVGLALLALNPAGTISAIMGDCGSLKAGAATVFALIGGLELAVQCIAAFGVWSESAARKARLQFQEDDGETDGIESQ